MSDVNDLEQAAIEYAEMYQQIGMYADCDKRMDAEKRALRNEVTTALHTAALQLCTARLAEVEGERDDADRIVRKACTAMDCAPADDDDFVEAVRLLVDERDAAIADLARVTADLAATERLLPGCLGEWTSGSGGHRVYTQGCDRPGAWNVGVGFVCDEHKNKHGGDDDAWTWQSERELLCSLASADLDGIEAAAERLLLARAELARLALTEEDREAARWFVGFGETWMRLGAGQSGLTAAYLHRAIALFTRLLARSWP